MSTFYHVPANYGAEFVANGNAPEVFIDGYMSSFGAIYNLLVDPDSSSNAYVSLASTAVMETTLYTGWNIWESERSSIFTLTTAAGSVIRDMAGGGGAIHAEGELHLQNGGLIDALRASIGTGPYAIQGMHGGEIQNYGSIHGEVSFKTSDAGASVVNYGQIVNEYDTNDAFEGSSQGDFFANRGNGLVVGAIYLNGGDDNYYTDVAIEGAVYGGDGSDWLQGGRGHDYLAGGGDDDTYNLGDDTTDTIYEDAGGGSDTIMTTVSRNLANYANVENLYLLGSGSIVAQGSSAANYFTAYYSDGANTLRGMGGDDTYLVSSRSVVDESVKGSGGTDTIVAYASYSLSDTAHVKGAVENLTIEGGTVATGNGLANTIDASLGGSGQTLRGLAGNDTYIIDANDIVDESAKGSGGTDTVRANFSVDIGDTAHFKGSIENVVLYGFNPIDATGNGLANVLDGSTMGHNHLTGKGGNDTYIINVGDLVDEATGGGGTDTIKSHVSVDLEQSSQVVGRIEKIVLLDGVYDAEGDQHDNTFTGNSIANLFTGRGGKDIFVFNTAPGISNIDTITDFAHGTDKIGLENSVYKAIGSSWSSSQFVERTADHKAQTSGQHVIYDKADGTLWYDSDGKGSHAAVEFAILQNHPATISSGDFVIV